MQARLPKNIAALAVVSCVLVALPLLVALLYAEIALHSLTQRTRGLLDGEMALVEKGMQLRGQIENLDRNLLQYHAIRDPRLADVAGSRWRDADTTLAALAGLSVDAPLTQQLTTLRHGFVDAHEIWIRAPRDAAGWRALLQSVEALVAQATQLVDRARVEADAHLHELRADGRRAQRQMLICSLLSLPLGVMLAYLFSLIVSRPLTHMSRAIAALGHGRYEMPATIRFPSELRRLAHHLEWLHRRLSRLEQDKDRFLRQVSHELKTPLASLYEGTELLKEGALGELTLAQTEVVAILSESAFELGGLIDNLLAYAEWRADRQTACKSWFDTRELVEEVLAVHRLPLIKRQLTVELDLVEGCLFGLRTQLRVALDNLVTNAIKHSPPGAAIEIHAGNRSGCFEVWVRDRGHGVPESKRQEIFEPFVRGSESEEQAVRGTGLGLSIVMEALLAHDGEVQVEDAHPGARFRLAWPAPAVG